MRDLAAVRRRFTGSPQDYVIVIFVMALSRRCCCVPTRLSTIARCSLPIIGLGLFSISGTSDSALDANARIPRRP